MVAKLTLKLDKVVIERAKEYTASHKRSLSHIIESYLQSLATQSDAKISKTDIQISPFVKSMSSGVHIPADLDPKVDYTDHFKESQIRILTADEYLRSLVKK